MTTSEPTAAHLRIAHTINEQIMVSHFTEQQRRILDLILRLSWGCGKSSAKIPHQKDFAVVGIGETHIKGHLDWLEDAKVIFRDGSYYQFNEDFDQWRVSRSLGYNPKKLSNLISLNLTDRGNGNFPKREVFGQGTYFLGKKNLTENIRNTETDTLSPKESIKEKVTNDTKALVDPIAQFSLVYEANIGMITATSAEDLRELSLKYPAEWFAEAVAEAVRYNHRNLKYIMAILKSWEANGKPNKKVGAKDGKTRKNIREEASTSEIEESIGKPLHR